MSDQNETQEVNEETQEVNEEAQEANEEIQEVNEEIIEVSWEDIKEIFQVREALKDVDARFSDLLLNYEKQKAAFLARSQELETFLYEQGSNLRNAMQIDPTVTYELKLPTNAGEKAYFLRKG